MSKRHEFSMDDINRVLMGMTMDQIRATEVFKKMPKSVMINGNRVPKSALRRYDLAKQYLMHGGKLVEQPLKSIKNYTPPRKKTPWEKMVAQRNLEVRRNSFRDHAGDLSKLRHAMQSITINHHQKAAAAATPTLETQEDDDDVEQYLAQLALESSEDDDANIF